METTTPRTPEEISMFGDVLELLHHPRRRDVRTQALHACVQCSSEASFLSFLKSLLPNHSGAGEAEKREVSSPTDDDKDRRQGKEALHPRKDLDRFLRSLIRTLGQEEDGASAAAVEVLINLSADEVLADYMVKRELHIVNVVVDNLEEQTKNEAPRHANISLMLLSNLTRKEEAGRALLEAKHGVPGFNLVRLIRVLDAAARSPARRLPNDKYWQEEGYFILSILQNISSLKEGTATLSGVLLPQLNSLLSLLPLLPPHCHSPLLRLCLNLCLDKSIHPAICRFPPPSFSSSVAAKCGESRCDEQPGTPAQLSPNGESVPASPTSTRDSLAPGDSPMSSPSSAVSQLDASFAEAAGQATRQPHAAPARSDQDAPWQGTRESGEDNIPCSLLIALASFLYPPPGPKRGFVGEDKMAEKTAQRKHTEVGNKPAAGASDSAQSQRDAKAKIEETEGLEKGEAGENTGKTSGSAAHADAEVARLRFLHPVVSRNAYGPAGSALSRKLIVDCFSALALTETGRTSMRESGIYEVLRCVHLDEKNSPVREEIENMVHVLVYSEEELKQQDEDLARSVQREPSGKTPKPAVADMTG
ncbi:conserved hypothetical protein [Neospora caninum Liverpool]|uniref:Protein HGH1 C-terminal domain-containing protein n=1 Tax=Neospora caninum (strain Liverpool) TaxID=572307 RepID=F0V8P2_NEOCL|nr:conserved hypothetical protein [Neospora caninum Liverpool]CBZ50083.1 conserved hypothetical protein [Neospora caninum Liverpool]CEL64678.1 TPA: hypothetical protein BN1204_005590 [Neospora caninum Liverpool]|eukprot:XP_003880118.1 conserved hypothetical protein [Neospora caninum Liverpool]